MPGQREQTSKERVHFLRAVSNAQGQEEAAVAAVPAKRPFRSRQRRNASGQQQQQQQRPASRQRSPTPQPFSFQTLQEEALRKKQARLQEKGQEEKEVRRTGATVRGSFSCQGDATLFPLLPFAAIGLVRPRCQSAQVTLPVPFRLASLTRHEEQKRTFQEKVKQMNQQLANLSKFVAKPCPTSRPFTAKLEQKHTVPDKVQLHSTTRAQQRHDFDSALSSRIHKRTAESEERKRAQEEAAIRELRCKTAFRANPMPRPKPPVARAAKRAAPRATHSASPSPHARKPRRSPRNPTPGMK
ncbi:hypothetical protein HPB47_019130 [Ixodes persulcatus]|uniref:Uncharacterized protein n=1 Tax=Ixodes persulcatus TaxID=34615 RepID=A0AC60QJU5_IXOPE|nr:hypothetical protein HPB47_019130 [Ixodes persulcatus]